jgi:hypothetical protein
MRENTREPHRHADRRNKYPSVEHGRGDDLSAPGAACEQIERADDWAPSSLEVAYMSMLVPVEFADAGTMTGKHPKYLSNKLRVSIVAPGTNEAPHVMRTEPQIASRFESPLRIFVDSLRAS